MHSRTLVMAAALGLMACARQVPASATPTSTSTEPRAVRLLLDTPARETHTLTQLREDVEVDATEGERTPRVVATGQTPTLSLGGHRARLYGDAKGTLGISVDNFLLLEVLDARGQVTRRATVGFTEAVHMGRELVDSVGRRAFTFEAGEVDITHLLPDAAPFQVRATALDTWGVGRVSDVYLLLAPGSRADNDDLRDQ
ncbi:hypothetical protein HV824_29005 [Myxococcus sp. AM009]|uniref:hypothetical protein n=1 Tax=unclassified Myxococcus TaxID=2648731 RepID=UPI0015957B5C|nr:MULTISPECIES: hypothetical protein [unclassified Myxococcus]NVJ02136.1 hypothetical protein [Myxococcus sp. AM009]NVJ18881.1 hypothetical protein [Myxococcus sp. AM010]